MDMKEASAMTEASGLVGEEQRVGNNSATGSGPPNQAGRLALSLSEELRRMTVKAPLRSLSIAFVLGILLARRR
jgi:hypothetical protein